VQISNKILMSELEVDVIAKAQNSSVILMLAN
jgi:hypothetical protein